jgi:hypothetical protein
VSSFTEEALAAAVTANSQNNEHAPVTSSNEQLTQRLWLLQLLTQLNSVFSDVTSLLMASLSMFLTRHSDNGNDALQERRMSKRRKKQLIWQLLCPHIMLL